MDRICKAAKTVDDILSKIEDISTIGELELRDEDLLRRCQEDTFLPLPRTSPRVCRSLDTSVHSPNNLQKNNYLSRAFTLCDPTEE